MVPVLEMQKPRVTEIQVRMDCQGCVHKIKKALHGINGIYDLYIDFPQQKLTIIGWADPEKIVKAIRKTRKIVTICSHTEVADPPPPPPAPPTPTPTPESSQPPPEAANPPPPEPQPVEQPPPAEPSPPKDQPPENPPAEASPPQTVTETNPAQPTQPPRTQDVGEVHVIHHHPPDYGYRYGHYDNNTYNRHWDRYSNGHGVPPHEPYHYQPMPVTHNYNTYRPSPYVTEYEHTSSQQRQMHYGRMDYYYNNEEYRYNNNHGNGNITAVFSDENPNACRIM